MRSIMAIGMVNIFVDLYEPIFYYFFEHHLQHQLCLVVVKLSEFACFDW